jgi:hypothetical protein
VRRVEGGEVCSILGAIEANQVAVDGHSGATGGVGGSACPAGTDGDVLRIAAAYYTYGGNVGSSPEVEAYRLAVFDGKGDIAAHVYLCLQSGGTCEKPYDEGEN